MISKQNIDQGLTLGSAGDETPFSTSITSSKWLKTIPYLVGFAQNFYWQFDWNYDIEAVNYIRNPMKPADGKNPANHRLDVKNPGPIMGKNYLSLN